jgi:hypothetical protein
MFLLIFALLVPTSTDIQSKIAVVESCSEEVVKAETDKAVAAINSHPEAAGSLLFKFCEAISPEEGILIGKAP